MYVLTCLVLLEEEAVHNPNGIIGIPKQNNIIYYIILNKVLVLYKLKHKDLKKFSYSFCINLFAT